MKNGVAKMPAMGDTTDGGCLIPSPGTPGEGQGGGYLPTCDRSFTPSPTLPRSTGGGSQKSPPIVAYTPMRGGMRTFVAVAIASAMLLTIFSTGCASSRRDALVARQVNISNRQLEIGQRVFMAECNQCHPGGAAGLGPALNNKPIPGFALRFQVRHGLGAMPKFSHAEISSEALSDLVLYVKTLRHEPMLVAHG